MSVFECRVLTELRKLREGEAALEGLYKKMSGSGADNSARFLASLQCLDDQVSRLENLLESAA